jgi:putative membrane protein
MTKRLLSSMVLALAGLSVSPAAFAEQDRVGQGDPGTAKLDRMDRDFLMDAALGGMFEVKAADLAQKQASSDQVKKFAQRMMDDHGKIDSQLAQIAQQGSVTLPTQLDKKYQDKIDALAKLGGPDFDKMYMDEMVKDHRTDIGDYQKESNSAKDPTVKGFASSTLPMLRDHLAAAQDVDTAVKSTK